MALGRLPSKLLAPTEGVLNRVLDCICYAARPDATVGTEKDAETRRNALVALARLSQTVGFSSRDPSDNTPEVSLNPRQTEMIFTAMFRGLNDYNVDRRGDIGSISRIAAIHGLWTVTRTVASTVHSKKLGEYFDAERGRQLIGSLLKQFAEKLDAVRLEAGKVLELLVRSVDPIIPNIEARERLQESLRITRSDVEGTTKWGDAATTFPLLATTMHVEIYFHYIISGLVISVSGLTQSVAEQASQALLSWIKTASPADTDRLGNCKNVSYLS